MTEVKDIRLPDHGFEMSFQNRFAETYTHPQNGVIACILKESYIPIAEFKLIFNHLSKEIRKGGYDKFVFDKRALRTFHQPSMEWYYVEWKTEMLHHGLTKHRKLLPELDWFVKAVAIAKRPLLESISQEVADRLNIVYCHSLQEAINT